MSITTTLPNGEYEYSIRLTREVSITVRDGKVTVAETDDEHSPSFAATGATSDAESRELTRIAEQAWNEGLD